MRLFAVDRPQRPTVYRSFQHFAVQASPACFEIGCLVWHAALSSFHDCERTLRIAMPPFQESCPRQRDSYVLRHARLQPVQQGVRGRDRTSARKAPGDQETGGG